MTRTPAASALLEAKEALNKVDIDDPAAALPLLREAVERLTDAIDESMASMVLDVQGTLRAAGSLAGLSENAVGPRLARTERLAPYASPSGRVTARGVERALYDEELGRAPQAGSPERPPMRFKPRRSRPD